MISFAEVLSTNSRLEELRVDSYCTHITSNGCAAFTKVLCNDSSIMDTYQSNHTLERLGYKSHNLPEGLASLLELNKENSESHVRCIKILKTHFSGSDNNLMPLTAMKLNIVPHAIAWMANDDTIGSNELTAYGMSVMLMFQFFCTMSMLIERTAVGQNN